MTFTRISYSFGREVPSGHPLMILIWVMTAVRRPDSSHILPVEKVLPCMPASVVCSERCHFDMSGGLRKRNENSREETADTSKKVLWAMRSALSAHLRTKRR